MKYIKKFENIDIFDDNDWDEEETNYTDIKYYIIYHQDKYFITKKKKIKKGRFYDYEYHTLYKTQTNKLITNKHSGIIYTSSIYGHISKDSKIKILNGDIKVSYIYDFNIIQKLTLQEICDFTNVDIETVTFM